MGEAQDDTASGAARALAARRWGSQAVDRAAETVISRAAELSPEVLARLHEVTGPGGGEGRGDS
jgi:hypothetical protein